MGLNSARCALVIGGARGIGRAIALALNDHGYRVTVTALTHRELEDFAVGDRVIEKRQMDVTDPQSVRGVTTEFRDLDALVNCAGIILREGREHETARFVEVVDVNLTGTMRVCEAARALLVSKKGCVVNIASMLSFFGSGSAPAYSASKGGVVQLTKSLAIAWAPQGVRVNAIAPGWIRTNLTAPLVNDETRSQLVLERTPMGRWGEPEDVAGAVLFLCSPDAGFITGVVLPVDGGYSCA